VFHERYGHSVYKLSVDGHFTCPNRDGTKGRGGCTYCNVDSFTPITARKIPSIAEQIERGAKRLKEKRNVDKFVLYFQANTNTYAPLETLRSLYDEAMSVMPESVLGLAIGTRPDCIDSEVLDLLESYTDRVHVTLELGLESIRNDTLIKINRGHTHEEFLAACELVRGRKLDLALHVILGFPGEDLSTYLEVIDVINAQPTTSVKFHQLHVVSGSAMGSSYKREPFHLLSLEEYAEILCQLLPRLRPDIAIERLFANTPGHFLIAPEWANEKHRNHNQLYIEKKLREQNVRQGSLFNR
jgi:hypothetical protein